MNNFIKYFPKGVNESALKFRYLPFLEDSLLDLRALDDGRYYAVALIRDTYDYAIDTTGKVFRLSKDGQSYEIDYIYRADRDPKRKNKRFYTHVTYFDRFGRKRTPPVHRLVLETFRSIEDSDKYFVNHLDNDPSNNDIYNLEWVNNGVNIAHGHLIKNGKENKLPIGIVARNVFTGEIKEYSQYTDLEKDLGIDKDVAKMHVKTKPVDFIRADGWQLRKRHEDKEWGEITKEYIHENITPISSGYLVKLYPQDRILTFETMPDASAYTGIGEATISVILNNQTYTKMHKARNGQMFQIKRANDPIEWHEYPSYWHAVDDMDARVKVIVVVDKETGKVRFCHDTVEATKLTNIGKTTILYRLNKSKGCTINTKPSKYTFYYLKDYVEKFGLPNKGK